MRLLGEVKPPLRIGCALRPRHHDRQQTARGGGCHLYHKPTATNGKHNINVIYFKYLKPFLDGWAQCHILAFTLDFHLCLVRV